MMEPLYYEAHVVFTPPKSGNAALAQKWKELNWWASQLLTDDSGEEAPADIILTTREETDLLILMDDMATLVAFLISVGVVVKRRKIEAALFDTRRQQ